MKLPAITLLSCTCVIVLGACSGSSENNNNAQLNEVSNDTPVTSLSKVTGSLSDFEQMGMVLLSDSARNFNTSAFATFFSLGSNAASYIHEFVAEKSDSCIVELFNEELIQDVLLNEYQSLSAGEVLTLTTPEGSYGELTRVTVQDGIGYVSFSKLAYPLPQTLTVSTPGDEFSAASITVESPPVPAELSLAVGDVVAPEADLTWSAGSNDTMLYMSFKDANHLDLHVECLLTDDGAYTLPASVHTEASSLVNAEVSIVFDKTSRIRPAAMKANDDLLLVVRSSS